MQEERAKAMKAPIIISMILLVIIVIINVISVFYEVKRPVYSNRLRRLARKILLLALIFGGVGIYLNK